MLEARNVSFRYSRRQPLLEGLNLTVVPGEIVGLSGVSGAGKSTVGRVLAGYLRPTTGTIRINGSALRGGRCAVQYLHQSSIFAVDPRWRIGRIVEEAWIPDEAMRDALGVQRAWYDRYPHEISGGELQRIAVLRALAPGVRYLVADEITAMLDPITQADIWGYLQDRCATGDLGILAISHDAQLLRRIAQRSFVLAPTGLPEGSGAPAARRGAMRLQNTLSGL
jgi:ABC-type dipeptide/oligopeptide/nickel transport system ATPase subunit